MKILQINSVFGFGSTGRNTEEIANFLTLKGHENYVAYAHGKTNYSNSFKYGYWLERKLHAIFFRLFGKQGLVSWYGTKRLIKFIQQVNPDVIHINSIHGNHLRFPILFNFISKNNYPIVWTLHDCWTYTGVCFHYTSENCSKWKTGCGKVCPHYHAILPDLGHDRVSAMYKLKKHYFTMPRKIIIVPVSQWLENEVKQSFLVKYPIKYVYNWIDQSKFKPDYENVRSKYHIPIEKEIILSVSAIWSKNSDKYNDAIKLQEKLSDKYCMVIVGTLEKGTNLPENIVHIPYIHNTSELAKIYTSALVYVHLSVEDTFGKVIAEAMACGTPVIVFDSTACPELVGEGSGFVAKPHDIESVIEFIHTIKKNSKAFYSESCIQRVEANFSFDSSMNKYFQIYQELIKS